MNLEGAREFLRLLEEALPPPFIPKTTPPARLSYGLLLGHDGAGGADGQVIVQVYRPSDARLYNIHLDAADQAKTPEVL